MNEDPEVAWRVDALRARLATYPDSAELVVRDLPATPGVCRSCGDPMPYDQLGTCTLCCLAGAAIVKEQVWRDANR